MGVLVFVLVSGYIITPVLGRGDMAEFVVKRAFRIDPLYLAAVLGEAAWLGTQGRASPAASTLLWRASLLGDWATGRVRPARWAAWNERCAGSWAFVC